MWVCKNLATGEYLTGAFVTLQDGSHILRIVTTPRWATCYTFKTFEEAAEFAFLGCEEFDLEGFEPVEE